MRRLVGIVLILSFLIGAFSGCKDTDTSEIEGEKMEPSGENQLVVYVLHAVSPEPKISTAIFHINHPDYELVVKTVDTFHNPEGLDPIMTEMMAGGGPDVVMHLASIYEKPAVLLFSLLRNQSLCDLEPLMEQSGFERENYRQAAFQSPIDDTIRTLAFSNYSNLIACTKEREAEYGLQFTDDMTVGEFSRELDKYLEQSEPSKSIFAYDVEFNELIAKAGGSFVDYQKKTAEFHTQDFRDLVECYRKILSRKGKSPADPEDYQKGFGNFIEGDALLYETIVGGVSEFVYAPITNAILEHQTEETLDVFSYPGFGVKTSWNWAAGGILERCENKEVAFDLLRRQFQSEADGDIISSLNLGNIQREYESAITAGAKPIDRFGYQFDQIPLPVELADRILNNYNTAIGYTPDGALINQFIVPCMQPYFNGEASLDECITQLDRQVQLYLHE